jgi:porin
MKSVKKSGPFLRALCVTAIVGVSSAWAGTATDNKELDSKALDNKNMAMATKSTSIWDQQELTGDWGGVRTELREKGVNITFNDIGDFLSDVSGSQTHHATYFGRVRGTVDIDFKKLADVDGRFFVTGMYQYGRNLSGQYLDIFGSTSSIAGEESLRLDEAWYDQGFIDSKVHLKFGQIAAVNDFGATNFDIFMSDETGYAANILFRGNQPFSPAGKPGAELTIDLSDITKGLYIKGGGFTAYNDAYHPDETGLNWNDDFNHGAVGAGEIGYVEQDTKYAGTYKIGFTLNDLAGGLYGDYSTGESVKGNYVMYYSMQKSVYHPTENGKLNTDKGLDILFQALSAPGDRNPVDFESLMGFRYTGLFEGRDKDELALGIIYANASSAYSRANQNAGGNSLDGETDVELAYKFHVTPWFAIQPDLQVIFDPRGDSARSDILVLGLRTVVNF